MRNYTEIGEVNISAKWVDLSETTIIFLHYRLKGIAHFLSEHSVVFHVTCYLKLQISLQIPFVLQEWQ